MAELSSNWLSLSPHLLAQFYESDSDGNMIEGSDVVLAPLVDEAVIDMTANWQSPFENSGIESKLTMVSALLSTGAAQTLVDSMLNGEVNNQTSSTLDSLKGSSGISKLTSTQAFSGSPPVKIQVIALFKAYADTYNEVELPVDKLFEWFLPIHLAETSTITSRAVDSDLSLADVGFPSKAPTYIGMIYKGRMYSPLVIEAISKPISSPVDSNGRFIMLEIPMTLSTLTSIDRNDYIEEKL